MNTKFKSLFKDSVVFALGSLGTKIILFLLVPLYTNYLTTGEYGTSDLVLNLASLMYIVFSMNINHAVLRFSMETNQKKEDVLVTALLFQIPLSVLILAAYPLLGQYTAVAPFRWYLIVQAFLETFSISLMAYLKAIGKNRLYAYSGIIRTAILAVTNIVVLRYMNMGIRGYLMANNLAALSAVVFPLLFVKVHVVFKEGRFSWDL